MPLGDDNLHAYQHTTVVSIGAQTQALADGANRIARVHAFNGSAGNRVFIVHDHASALSGTNPIHIPVLAGTTATVEGPFRFTLGCQVEEASDASEATAGITLVHRPFNPTLE